MGFFTAEEGNLTRLARGVALGVIVLAAAAGLTFGLLLPSVARADDPPPTTVPSPTVPVPDPAPPKPAPKPAPKPTPKPRPAPKPASTPPRQQSPAPTYTPPSPAPVAPQQTPGANPQARVPAKAKPKKVRHKKLVAKPKVVLSKVTTTPAAGAVRSVRQAFQTKSSGNGSADLGSLLIVMGLALAIACFAVAMIPATYVKWRPAAIFVSERQVDFTVVGFALLVAAAFTFLWSRGL